MKHLIVVILFLCAGCSAALAQTPPAEVSTKQWQDVLVAVSGEQWDKAFQLASQYKEQMKPGDERLPRLRYIYLYAAAGRVAAGVMSFDEMDGLLKDFVGKEIALPYRPIAVECHGDLNYICAQSSKDKLVVAAANKSGTTIHAFEYVQLKEEFDAASYRDQYASITGVVEAIKLNPNKSRFLVMRIYVTGGVVTLKR